LRKGPREKKGRRKSISWLELIEPRSPWVEDVDLAGIQNFDFARSRAQNKNLGRRRKKRPHLGKKIPLEATESRRLRPGYRGKRRKKRADRVGGFSAKKTGKSNET